MEETPLKVEPIILKDKMGRS
ncbi:hypothetical protein Goshw_008982 [Gossypium schwendimanii]|uniref:Uncharacterized protein n=1 Tax=Gossypium schwendimanii TaxID=34291 RepID=A0A7J9KWL1_GOSSC|nr:hypothetical protein [Gossypium schwendimanii]